MGRLALTLLEILLVAFGPLACEPQNAQKANTSCFQQKPAPVLPSEQQTIRKRSTVWPLFQSDTGKISLDLQGLKR